MFLSGMWVTLSLLTASLDPFFNWMWFLVSGLIPVAFAWGLWWVREGFRHSNRTFDRTTMTASDAQRLKPPEPTAHVHKPWLTYEMAINGLLVIGTLVIGVMIASLQDVADNNAQLIGAALAPALVGLAIGGIRRLFGHTEVLKWMFGWSVVALAIEMLQHLTSN